MKDFDVVDENGNLVCAFRFAESYASVYVPALRDILLGYVADAPEEMTDDELRALIAAPGAWTE